MAFQPQGGQEVQNRKILQDLQERKRQMITQQTSAGPSTSANVGPGHATRPQDSSILRNDSHQLAVGQQQALQQANTASPGYYITQDSLFGNLIIPVLPRVDTDT